MAKKQSSKSTNTNKAFMPKVGKIIGYASAAPYNMDLRVQQAMQKDIDAVLKLFNTRLSGKKVSKK